MASLFRPQWTRDGKTHRSRIWWAEWRVNGKPQRCSLKTANKEAAQLKLSALLKDAQAMLDGRGPVAKHIADWADDLRGRGVTRGHVILSVSRVTSMTAAFKTIVDMQAAPVEAYLRQLQVDGRSAKTRNCYCDSVKAFGRWLWEHGRLPANPFARLRHVNIAIDRRHDRRPLTPDEIARLLTATLASDWTFRTLGPADRHALYLTALATGFRAGELASLTVDLCRLDDNPPVILLPARDDKARRAVRQPIAASVAAFLRAYLRGRIARTNSSALIWPGSWKEEPIKMLRHDLAAAGIPYETRGPDGTLYVDFHALRHTFIALLDRPGITLRQAMHLARHSDPRLTMRTYARSSLADLAAAVSGSVLVDLLAGSPGTHGHLASNSGPPKASTSGASSPSQPEAAEDVPTARAG